MTNANASLYVAELNIRSCVDLPVQRLKELEESLDKLRTVSAAKPKFAFKRKAHKPQASPQDPSAILQSSSGVLIPSVAEPLQGKDVPVSSSLTLSSYSHKYLRLTSISLPTSSASDLTISDLDHCVVNLLAATTDGHAPFAITALHIRNIRNSILILPRIEGSALLHDLSSCIVVLGCHQVLYCL